MRLRVLRLSGRSAYYVEMVARAGLIGIHTVAAPPMVAPPGGAEAALGTNPTAFGRERARLAREGIEIDRRIHDALIQLAEGKQ